MTINKRTFLSAVLILLILLIMVGCLTRILPMGVFDYKTLEGHLEIIPGSYHLIDEPPIPIYKWFTAPIDVIFTDSGVIVVMIIVFLIIIGGSIHILNEIQLLEKLINQLIYKFRNNKWLLVHMVTLLFMSLGAFIGIFEEVVPLVPLIVLLSQQMGFDVLMGLGMSLLATGFGFAAAVSNPFTIGVAQKIAELPLFSGGFYRVIIFLSTYIVLNIFLKWYGMKIEKKGQVIPREKAKVKGLRFLILCLLVLFILIMLSPFVEIIASLNLPIIAILFLIAGFGSGLIFGLSFKHTAFMFLKGAFNMLPAVLLILLATGIKHLLETGQIMGTILNYTAQSIEGSTNFMAILSVFVLVLILNFFIGSGSAKAFIVMPLIAPLMDMLDISRQMAVLAFQFGDGFSNILYPTNAVLLISLGLAGVGYGKWFKWVLKLQVIMFILSIVFLWIGLKIGY